MATSTPPGWAWLAIWLVALVVGVRIATRRQKEANVPIDGQHSEASTLTTQIIATGLGLVGGIMPVLYGQDNLTPRQRGGCVLAGGTTAFALSPLIPVAWPTAPTGVICAAGYFFGIGGIFLVRGLLAWLNRAERRLPDQIDRRAGIDTHDATPQPPTPSPAEGNP
jgi:hypothetical protein